MSKRIRVFFLVVADILSINLAILLSLLIKFDLNIPRLYIDYFLIDSFVITSIQICVFAIFGLYRSLWEYAGIDEALQVFYATVAAALLSCISSLFIGSRFPYTIYIATWVLTLMLLGGTRLSYRLLRRALAKWTNRNYMAKRVMVIGAGSAGSMIIKEMKNHPELNHLPVVAFDDDTRKHGTRINGVKVFGGRKNIARLTTKYKVDEIVLAIPSASKKDTVELLQLCKETRCKLRKLPSLDELLSERITLNQLREVSIEDLLGRNEVELEIEKISGYLKDEVVLVTGGGGSIGSELCRQIAKFEPKKLIIFDNYENNAYDLQNELIYIYKEKLDMDVLIGSCRDRLRLKEVFERYRPGVVFHAAAHKHVPLMEGSPSEAIKNNVFGTLNTARRADDYGAKKFILVSTDKAVNPTNIMGASKRLAEIIVQSMNRISSTKFSAVRFGNVLGSNGSVIPLFNKQIMQGGPVTVTHPDIVRYFMTIPEAAKLVIQSGALAQGGEVYVLDMGKPVKIVDLARDLIKLNGLEPDVDIKIEYTGLRPGEKLYEELLMAEEGLVRTAHEKIFIGKQADMSFQEVIESIKALENSMESDEMLRECMARLVPTYRYAVSMEEPLLDPVLDPLSYVAVTKRADDGAAADPSASGE